VSTVPELLDGTDYYDDWWNFPPMTDYFDVDSVELWDWDRDDGCYDYGV
jgi:hypothetical protein